MPSKKTNAIAPIVEEATIQEKRNIETITAEIQFYKQQAGISILEIGHRLNEAKEQLEHGEWLGWLEKEIEFSEGTAQRFMRLSREYSNPALVADLGSSKALILLALPATDREDFVEETHVVDGKEKKVTDMSKRELDVAVKERAAALDAKKAAETIAEEARKTAEELSKKLESAQALIDGAQREAEKNAEELAAVQKELSEVKGSDSELPEEAGQQMMEDIRKQIAAEVKKETEEKLKKKIDTATTGKTAAENKLKDAEDEKDRIKKEMENSKKAYEQKVTALEKKLAAASSEHVTMFKIHFDTTQEHVNKMVGCILMLKDEPETRDKLAAALKALCDKTLQSLPSPEKKEAAKK